MAQLPYIRFGRTGLEVSRLCLGTATFGGQCDEATSFAIMDHATDLGITFFDTADKYPIGRRLQVRGCDGGTSRPLVGRSS